MNAEGSSIYGEQDNVTSWADLRVGDVIIEEESGRAVFVLVGKNELNELDSIRRSGFYWNVYILVPAWFERPPPWHGAHGFRSKWIWANVRYPAESPIPLKHTVLRNGRFIRMG